jgi:hypothetical protein
MSLITRLTLSTALVLMWTATPTSAGDAAKAARGIVTSLSGGSIAINLPSDTDIIFRVDENTRVVARGAGRKMRQAQADGAAGVKLADVLPIGVSVEVRYEERAGQRYARQIISLASNGR